MTTKIDFKKVIVLWVTILSLVFSIFINSNWLVVSATQSDVSMQAGEDQIVADSINSSSTTQVSNSSKNASTTLTTEATKNNNSAQNSTSSSAPLATNTTQNIDYIDLELTPKNKFDTKDIRDFAIDKNYESVALESSFFIGGSEITDFVSRSNEQSLEELDAEIVNSRDLLLTNMLDQLDLNKTGEADNNSTSKTSKNLNKNSDINSNSNFSKSELENTQDKLRKNKNIEFKKVKFTLKNSNVDKFEIKARKNSKIKNTKKQDLKKNSEIEQKLSNSNQSSTDSNSTYSQPSTNSIPTQDLSSTVQSSTSTSSSKESNKLANLTNALFSPIPVEAQTAPVTTQASNDWIPNESSVSFFDTDEIGYYPYSAWTGINPSQTYYSVASTYHNNRLFLMHTATDGALQMGSLDYNGNYFSGWNVYNGTFTQDAPVLASFNGKLFQGHRASGNQLYLRYSTNNGSTWSNWYQPGGAWMSSSFSMTVYSNQLCILYRVAGANTTMYLGCSSDGINWPTWKNLTGTLTKSSPTSTSAFGYLWQGHRGSNNEVWVRKCWNMGDNCENWFQIWGATTYLPFTISSYGNNQICVMHTGTDSYLYQSCSMNYGQNWHPWRRFDGASNSGPTISGKLDRLAQIHRGTDNKIYIRVLKPYPGKRGYFSEMKWNNPGGGFGYFDSYEHDLTLLNEPQNGYSTYLTKQDSYPAPICSPYITYIASNLPESYLDTRLDQDTQCDSAKNYITYTIGSAWAKDIRPNVTYFNYWLTNKGEGDKPIFYVNAQKGVQNPAPCTSLYAWCIFATNSVTIIKFDININRGLTAPYWYKSK